MLALLALALFPVAAQAEECTTSSCVTYEQEVPTIGGGGGKPGKENPLNDGSHHDSGTHAKAEGSDAGGTGGTGGGETAEEPETESGSESEGEGHKQGAGSPSGGGGNNPPNSGGEGGSKSKGGGSEVGLGESKEVANTQSGEPASSSGSSSPVVPILIAVVVLAAISIGVVLYRQRKSGQGPDGRGSSVSSSNAS